MYVDHSMKAAEKILWQFKVTINSLGLFYKNIMLGNYHYQKAFIYWVHQVRYNKNHDNSIDFQEV